MSSVVISGDVSGSVTLQAPSAAGTTVLTLPATSGTVVTGPGGVTQVDSGGTGASTLTANNVILGNGTSAVQFVAPGSSGNVLTSNGTTWTSAAAGGGQLQSQLFTAPGTWTKPSSVSQVRVTVVGGGGGAYSTTFVAGSGGLASAIVPVSAPVSITVGSGGVNGTGRSAGGTSSFGSAVSATGGAAQTSPSANGAPGTGTVSTGTALKDGVSMSDLASYGILCGLSSRPFGLGSSTPYTTSSQYIAGAAGTGSAPGGGSGGVGGAVVVEFVG